MRFQAPRGTEDVLPGKSEGWLLLESKFRELVHRYGYSEIRTPVFEDTDLFVRSSGETSDIVTKQMYTFLDKGGRFLTLKPEGTAPAMRAAIEHSLLGSGSVSRLSYITPIFRYERPQKGRLREAHQVGFELVGSSSPGADAEVIEVTVKFYEAIGISNPTVRINSIGRDECREKYREAILLHADSFIRSQPEEAQARILKNPLRLLDSKDPAAQETVGGLPPITDYLEDESRARFEGLQQMLADAGVAYQVAPEIVRGLDYYTETVFEVQSGLLGAQSALCGGGRYDNLIADLGGGSIPSVGVAMGIERALIVLDQLGIQVPKAHPEVFVIQASPESLSLVQEIARELRAANVATVVDLDAKSVKSQLRQADKLGATIAVIVGHEKTNPGMVEVKAMAESNQIEVPRIGLLDWLKGRL